MKRALGKLQGMSLDELRVRGLQAAAAFSERHSWSAQIRLPDDESFWRLLGDNVPSECKTPSGWLSNFSHRTNPKFFAGFEDKDQTIAELSRRWPASKSRIVAAADRIIAGRYDLLGLRNLSFGEPIDWHFEPIAKKRAPNVHWSRLNYLDAEVAGDKKIIWELNRHQHFVLLGQAYWLTGDEKYAEEFAAQLKSWMDANPPKQGINWASSLEISFRSIAWLWAFHFFRQSPSLTASLFLRATKFLYLNARHLETFLSTYFSPNTHLTGEALGLFYLGTVLPELREAQRWRETGLEILLAQLDRHVRADGVYFEQTSYYHRYTTDFYLHLLLLLRANGHAPPKVVHEKLQLLLDHLMYITRPDGTSPLFGDDDGGRLLKLDDVAPNDFRGTLSTGAAVLDRGDYKFVAGEIAEETLWLLGIEAIRRLSELPATEPGRQSMAFPRGGYYTMRDGWGPNANYLFFDCGPHGTDNCGHAHADALSFELAANGRTLLVDPGTFTYTATAEQRDWFRSSAAHNTLTVDNQSSSIPDGPFSWRSIGKAQAIQWFAESRFDFVSGANYGYSTRPGEPVHVRSILFLKHDYWIVRDEVACQGEHELKLWFHFDRGVAQLHSRENEIQVFGENGHGTRLQVASFAPGGTWTNEPGWVSRCYAEKEEAPVFAFSVLANGPAELVTFLMPRESGVLPRAAIHEIEAGVGRGFVVDSDGHHDLLLIRSFSDFTVRDQVETSRLGSDFELTWARFAGEKARRPDEVVVLNGQRVELEGRVLLQSPVPLGFVFLRRIAERDGLRQIALPGENGLEIELDESFEIVGFNVRN